MALRIVIILSVIALTAVYAVYQKNSLEVKLVPSNKVEAVLSRLPSASFETMDGQKVDLDQFYTEKKPRLLVVHYWGTWCGPCEAELPELLNLIKRFSERPDVHFFLVAVNDEKIKVQKHLKTLGIPSEAQIHWLLDNNNVHRDVFGTSRVPETYVFSSDKTTLRKYVGPQEWNKTMFFQSFDDFIQISNSPL